MSNDRAKTIERCFAFEHISVWNPTRCSWILRIHNIWVVSQRANWSDNRYEFYISRQTTFEQELPMRGERIFDNTRICCHTDLFFSKFWTTLTAFFAMIWRIQCDGFLCCWWGTSKNILQPIGKWVAIDRVITRDCVILLVASSPRKIEWRWRRKYFL